MKTRIFKVVWTKTLINGKPFALWVVRFGRKYQEITRYFDTWADAVDYVHTGRAENEARRIYMGLY